MQARHVAQVGHNPNINALLNPSNTPTHMIDPNLEASIDRAVAQSEEVANRELLAGIQAHARATGAGRDEELNETDTKLAHALQGFSDGQGQAGAGAGGQG